jgi:hypothetical protein
VPVTCADGNLSAKSLQNRLDAPNALEVETYMAHIPVPVPTSITFYIISTAEITRGKSEVRAYLRGRPDRCKEEFAFQKQRQHMMPDHGISHIPRN